MTRLFAHRSGRHCRHGSLTGWSSLSLFFPDPVDDFTRPTSGPRIHPYAERTTR